jgi:hypothetical protein
MNRLVFSDESIFHLPGLVNWHNLWTRETETTHESYEHKRASPKDNVFAAMSEGKVCGSFFFAELTVAGIVCLDVLQG